MIQRRISPVHFPFLSMLAAMALILCGCSAKSGQSLTNDGRSAYEKKDYKAAIIHFKSALQNTPGSAEVRLLLGDSLLATRDAPGAVVELNKAIDEGADPDKAVPLLAKALLQAGESKRLVLKYSDTKLKSQDSQAALKAVLATAWELLGDQKKAAAELDAAVAASPDYPPVAMMRARQLEEENKVDLALKVVDGILEKDPNLAEAWVLKGALLGIDKSNNPLAEAAFRKAIELDKLNFGAYFSLFNLHLRLNNIPEAKKDVAAQREALPNHLLTAYVEAQLALAEGDLNRAREITQKLVNRAPDVAGVHQIAGAVAMLSSEFIQAEFHYSKALQIDPQSIQARRELARVYLHLSQPRRALETLRTLLDSPTVGAETMALAGDTQLALGDATAAESLFLRAAKLTPDDVGLKTSLALTHLAKGESDAAFSELAAAASASPNIVAEQAAFSARMARREFDAALVLVDQIAKKSPKNLIQYDLRGEVYLARKDWAQARKAYEAQFAANPKLTTATVNLAAIDLLENKPDDARKRLQAAIEADPKNPYAKMALAELKINTGAPLEDIRSLLNSAIQTAPQLAEARLRLISLTIGKRLYKEALVAAQEAAAALPNDPAVLDAVGRAQMEAGDVEQAMSTFRKLAGVAGKSGLAYTRLADIYKATGKRDQAETALRKALEIEPGLVQAQLELINLLSNSDRKSDAMALAKRMQRDMPNLAAGYSIEAAYQLNLKSVDAAIAAYRTGLAQTGDADLALQLHRVYSHAGRHADADRFASTWLRDHPKDTTFNYQVAEAEVGRNELDKAEGRLLRLQASNPDNVLVLNNLANVLLMRKRPGALTFAQKAAELAPGSSSVLDTLATALLSEKQYEKALAAQKRSVEHDPQSDSRRLRLAAIAIKANDKALARTELTRLQGLGAKFKAQDEVTRLLKTLG